MSRTNAESDAVEEEDAFTRSDSFICHSWYMHYSVAFTNYATHRSRLFAGIGVCNISSKRSHVTGLKCGHNERVTILSHQTEELQQRGGLSLEAENETNFGAVSKASTIYSWTWYCAPPRAIRKVQVTLARNVELNPTATPFLSTMTSLDLSLSVSHRSRRV